MPPVHVVHVEVDLVAFGCSLCGYSVKGKPDELELLVSVMLAHLGRLVSAQRLSLGSGPFQWVGDPDLVAQVTHASR